MENNRRSYSVSSETHQTKNTGLFEHLQYADVGGTFGTAPTQYQPHLLALRHAVEAKTEQEEL